MSTPRVSVVIPTYQDPDRALEAVASVLAQDLADWEVILVDDGSVKRDQVRVAEGLAQLGDARLRYVPSQRNRGPARARNLGIRLAHGRYLAFLDADDLWHPTKLSHQLSAMQNARAAISCTAYENVTIATGERRMRIPPAQISYAQLLRQNSMGCSTVMLDRQIIGRSYFPDIRMRQDFAHWLRILRSGHQALGLPDALTERRLFAHSLSSNKIRAAWYTWRMYRDIEKFGVWRAGRCFGAYALGGLFPQAGGQA